METFYNEGSKIGGDSQVTVASTVSRSSRAGTPGYVKMNISAPPPRLVRIQGPTPRDT